MKSNRVEGLITLSVAGSEGQMGASNYLQWHETEKEIQNQRRRFKKLSLVSMLIQNGLGA